MMFLGEWYRDTAALQAGSGYQDLAALIDRVGVPLEVVSIVNDRVMEIDAFDYEEGLDHPLARRTTYWYEVLGMAPVLPVRTTSALFAVHPDGSWHLLASAD
jgi:hypothetical protein